MADVPLGWTVEAPSVASVNDAGMVTGGGGGRTLVTVRCRLAVLPISLWVPAIQRWSLPRVAS
jgi:hypothetical protein